MTACAAPITMMASVMPICAAPWVKESVLSCAEPSDPSDCEVQLGPGPEWSGLRHLVVTLGAASARTSGLAQPHHQAARRRFERGAVNHLDLPRLAPRDTPRNRVGGSSSAAGRTRLPRALKGTTNPIRVQRPGKPPTRLSNGA